MHALSPGHRLEPVCVCALDAGRAPWLLPSGRLRAPEPVLELGLARPPSAACCSSGVRAWGPAPEGRPHYLTRTLGRPKAWCMGRPTVGGLLLPHRRCRHRQRGLRLLLEWEHL